MIQNKICKYIQSRAVISFVYKGQQRVVEPHLLGYDSDGDLTISAWQTSGGSGQGWRDFHVSKVSSISATGSVFAGARQGYNPHDSTISRIVCKLS